MKYAITITMRTDYFNEHFKLNGSLAIAKDGSEWTVISKNLRHVEIGQYPSYVMPESKEIH